MNKETEAQLKLAEAMNRLAEGIEKFQDPAWWQRVVGQAFQTLFEIPAIQPMVAQALPAGVSLESIIVRLTDEERQDMSQKVYEALQPQLDEFTGFVKDSLQEMPAHQLKELSEQIKKGAKPTLKKRRGCIFVVFDSGYEAYLSL